MKTKIIFIIAFMLYLTTQAQNISFADPNFKQALLNHNPSINTDNNHEEISFEEAKRVTEIKITSNSNAKITSIGEIKYFEALKVLHIENQLIRFADLSKNLELKELKLINNNRRFSKINIDKNEKLETLKLVGIDFFIASEFSVSNNINLKTLQINDTNIFGIDLSNKLLLENLDLNDNKIRGYLALNSLPKLTTVDISNNELGRLLVSNCTALSSLNVANNRNNFDDLSIIQIFGGTLLNTLDVSSLSKLSRLEIPNSNISSIDLSNNLELSSLNLENNDLSSIDLTSNIELYNLNLQNNNLAEIDVTKNVGLLTLLLESNNLTEIDVTKNERLEFLNVTRNKLSEINVLENNKLEHTKTPRTSARTSRKNYRVVAQMLTFYK